MGVSYASPAYYADRLADRGRAYIREFIVGNEDLRQQLHEEKKRMQPIFKQLRTAIFGEKEPSPTTQTPQDATDIQQNMAQLTLSTTAQARTPALPQRKDKRKKTRDEEIYDIVERELMEAECNKWCLEKIKSVWGDLDKDPWHEDLGRSMFWM
jgi:hypothetical protein